MNLPSALHIGPQRAGTTWIYRYLAQRGDVLLPHGVKETFFFDRNYDRGLEWYESHFKQNGAFKRTVEVGPTYFHCPEAPQRIRQDLGVIPLICTLRNPVERCFSLYVHMRRYGMTGLPFEKALSKHPEILGSSRYATHLKRWKNVFGSEQILVTFQERLLRYPDGFVQDLCSHLELPAGPIPENLRQRVNESTLPPNRFLAAFGQFIADSFRSVRLYGVVNISKRLGLKRLFFGAPSSGALPALGQHEAQVVLDELREEIVELEQVLQVDLTEWKTVG